MIKGLSRLRRGLGKRHRQLHGLGLGVGERIGLVVDRIVIGSPPGLDPALGVRRVFMKRFRFTV